MRLMILYFTPEELSHLLTEISRVMKPGGYFEVVDTNYTIRHAGPLSNKLVNQDCKLTYTRIHV
jgi:ubiquinone/menaquinone biosynthesis C-methylase UbiE